MSILKSPLSVILSVILTAYFAVRAGAAKKDTDGGLKLERLMPPSGAFLAPFLIPRAPGTEGNKKVQAQLRAWFSALGWHEMVHESVQNTPRGPITFTNLVFTKNPNASKRIVLSAHYDSKITARGQSADYEFVGATDSALPCAMIVELCHALNGRVPADPDVTLQAVFFDGEEAVENWTDTDSLYGSRHLAQLWKEGVSPQGVSRAPRWTLNNIQWFILLDLLGAAAPSIPLYGKTADPLFKRLIQIEKELTGLRLIHKDPSTTRPDTYFRHTTTHADYIMIQDDHVPFFNLGLRRILHFITAPFPHVWHRMEDNVHALDGPTISDLTLIMYNLLHGLL